jgi:hypothetical protein
MPHLLSLHAVEVAEVLRILLVAGEVVEVGRVGCS